MFKVKTFGIKFLKLDNTQPKFQQEHISYVIEQRGHVTVGEWTKCSS